MFKKGDYIVYGSTGVCEVLDVTTMHMDEFPMINYIISSSRIRKMEVRSSHR